MFMWPQDFFRVCIILSTVIVNVKNVHVLGHFEILNFSFHFVGDSVMYLLISVYKKIELMLQWHSI